MSYNAKNYTEQGGETTHFGGKVVFEQGCEVEGGSFTEVKTASETYKGIVKIGDGIDVDSDGEISVAPATDDTVGGVKGGASVEIAADGTLTVKPAENQAASEATTIAQLKDDFNALLTKLIAAGFVAEADSE